MYAFGGKSYRAYDSALQTLRIMELLDDETLDAFTKVDTLLKMMFPDDISNCEDVNGLISAVLWESAGIDVDGTHDVPEGEKAFDWEDDAEIISTSIYQTYGKTFFDVAREVTYRELISMMSFVPYETPLGQALYYRLSDPPKKTDYNEESVKHWHEMHDFWEMDTDFEERAKAMNNVANDIFSAYKVAANG